MVWDIIPTPFKEIEMKKRIMLLFFTMMILSSCSFKDNYVIGVIDEVPPYIYKNGDNYAGLDVEILDAIVKSENASYKIKKIDMNDIEDELKDGNIDALLFNYNQEKNIKLTNPFVDLSIAVGSLGRKNGIEDIANKKVGILKTSPLRTYVEGLRGKYGFALLTFDNVDKLQKSLEEDGIEYIADDENILNYIHKKNEKVNIGYVEKVNRSLIGVNKNKDKFLDLFNKGLINIVNSGKYKEIMQTFK